MSRNAERHYRLEHIRGLGVCRIDPGPTDTAEPVPDSLLRALRRKGVPVPDQPTDAAIDVWLYVLGNGDTAVHWRNHEDADAV